MEFIKLNIQFFGASNSASATLPTATNGSNKGKVEVSFTERDISTQNIIDNKTTIDLSGSFTQTSGYWSQISSPMLYLEWWDDKRNTWTEIAKQNVTAVSRNVPITLSGTIDVEHKADGSLTGKARTRWVYEASSKLVPRSGTAETNLTPLSQVPRTNELVAYDGTIGKNATLTINRKAPNSETLIEFASGNTSGVAKARANYNGDITWTIPKSLYNEISSTGKLAQVKVTATTFINDVPIGHDSKYIYAYVDEEDSKPEVSVEAIDVRTETKNLTGNERVVVLNASTIRCTYSATAKNGAYIKSANINNVALTGGSTTISGTKDFVKPTTNTFTLSATDSRDLPNSNSKTLSKIDYFIPTLNATIERNTPTDGKVNILFNGKFYNGSFGAKSNEIVVHYRYAEKGASLPDWTEITPYTNGNNFSNNGKIQLDGFDYQKAYTFQLMISDKLNTITKTQDISVGRPSPWWDKENMYVDGDYYSRNSSGVLEKIPTKNEVVESAYLGQNPDIDSLHYKSGTYGIYGCTQAPHGGLGKLEVLVYSADWATQRFTDGYGSLWQREFVEAYRWTGWEKVGRGLTCTTVMGISLGAGATYQISLPEYTAFIEPLVYSDGAEHSGGSIVFPDNTFNYIVNSTYANSENPGIWIRISGTGLAVISEYRHSGAAITGFRIWYNR